MDVIAKCSFGMKIDHLEKEDDIFMRQAKRVFNPEAMKSPLVVTACK